MCSIIVTWLHLYPQDFVGSADNLNILRSFLHLIKWKAEVTSHVQGLHTELESTEASDSEASDEGPGMDH